MQAVPHATFERGQLHGAHAGQKAPDELGEEGGSRSEGFDDKPGTEEGDPEDPDCEDWEASVPVQEASG